LLKSYYYLIGSWLNLFIYNNPRRNLGLRIQVHMMES